MKILIADDNTDHVLTLSTLLEGEGFEVRTASQAEQILPLTESFRAISAALSRQSPDTGRAPRSFILCACTSPPSVRVESSMTPASQTIVSQGRRWAARFASATGPKRPAIC